MPSELQLEKLINRCRFGLDDESVSIDTQALVFSAGRPVHSSQFHVDVPFSRLIRFGVRTERNPIPAKDPSGNRVGLRIPSDDLFNSMVLAEDMNVLNVFQIRFIERPTEAAREFRRLGLTAPCPGQ